MKLQPLHCNDPVSVVGIVQFDNETVLRIFGGEFCFSL